MDLFLISLANWGNYERKSLQKVITPGNFNKSIMHFRLSSNDESERMPLLGRTVVHDEGVALLEEYISSLTQTCN